MSGTITIDPTLLTPSHIGAVIARLRRFTDIMALCPDEGTGRGTVRRVSAQLQPIPEKWTGHAVLVKASGLVDSDVSVPRSRQRVDTLCYGSTGYEAERLANVVLAALYPADRYDGGFTEGDCRIVDVFHVAGPLPGYDRENRRPYVALSFVLDKSDLPVAEE